MEKIEKFKARVPLTFSATRPAVLKVHDEDLFIGPHDIVRIKLSGIESAEPVKERITVVLRFKDAANRFVVFEAHLFENVEGGFTTSHSAIVDGDCVCDCDMDDEFEKYSILAQTVEVECDYKCTVEFRVIEAVVLTV